MVMSLYAMGWLTRVRAIGGTDSSKYSFALKKGGTRKRQPHDKGWSLFAAYGLSISRHALASGASSQLLVVCAGTVRIAELGATVATMIRI